VPVQFHLLGSNRYGFTIGAYDHGAELVIDPLLYSTFIPGTAMDFSVDRQGNKLICGCAEYYTGFPTTPGAYQDSCLRTDCWWEGFVSKYTPDATAFLFSTYFYGGGFDAGKVRADVQGNIYFFTDCMPGLWPLTPDAFDTTGGASLNMELGLARLSGDGATLQFSSLLGGSGDEEWTILELDTLGQVYLAGNTASHDFPVTPNAWYPTSNANTIPFLAVFNPATSQLKECTYFTGLAGSAYCLNIEVVAPGRLWIAVVEADTTLPTTADALQPTYLSGHDFMNYFALLDLDSHRVCYGSYFGGRQGWGSLPNMFLTQIQPADSNRLWLVGESRNGMEFPMPAGGYDSLPTSTITDADAFIVQLELPHTLRYGTYLGGHGIDYARAVCMDTSGNLLVTGVSTSTDFPVTPDAFCPFHHGGWDDSEDVFLARLSPDVSRLTYSTYIGGFNAEFPFISDGLWYEGQDRLWLAGEAWGSDFPITPDAFWPTPSGSFLLHFELPPVSDAAEPHNLPPSSFSLSCAPNPFNPSTRIAFTLPKAGKTTLAVYDVLGREVAVLVDQKLTAGEHAAYFDGSRLASGIYFCTLHAGEQVVTRKMVMLK
jgi:hypothetical protein